MFLTIVFVCLMILLICAGGAALHLGIFKAGTTSLGIKCLTGILSYGLSLIFWLGCYSHHHLGW